MRARLGHAVRRHQALLGVCFTLFTGVWFIYSYACTPVLLFRDLSVLSDITSRRGFFNVMRWAEAMESNDQLELFQRLVQGAHVPQSTISRSSRLANAVQYRDTAEKSLLLATLVERTYDREQWLHLSKAALICAMCCFIYNAQIPLCVSTRAHYQSRAVPAVCLALLVVLCTRMTHGMVREVARTKEDANDTKMLMHFRATFLATLFMLRYGAMAVLHVLLGRAYQGHFGRFPATWRAVPKYLGSHVMILPTLFFTSAALCVMAATSPALRALSEAACHIEALALGGSFVHWLHVYTSA